MGYKGRYANSAPKKAGKMKKWQIVICVILAVILVAAAAVTIYFNSMLKLVNRAEMEYKEVDNEQVKEILGHGLDETLPEETGGNQELFDPADLIMKTVEDDGSYGKTGKIVNILLIGQDGRAGEEAKLSDTMILCSVNKETKTLSLISFMRDLYVKLPDFVEESGRRHECGRNRINTAYALGYLWGGDAGAMKMLDDCILINFGVQVDRNVEVDFVAFEKVINSLGGIEVTLNADEAKYMTKLPYAKRTFEEGSYLLDGFEALNYARMRKSNPADNDFKRTGRQRDVMAKILERCKSLSLKEMNDLMKTILPLVTTDMSNEDISTYALELLPLVVDLNVNSVQCPAEGAYSGKIVNLGGYDSGVVEPNLPKNRELLMSICEEVAEETQP